MQPKPNMTTRDPIRGAATHTHPEPVLPTAHGLASLNESMESTLSSITDLSSVSNTTATTQQIATEVSQYIQGSMHCQQHISHWLLSIQANFPHSAASISILLKIKRLMEPALVFTYSVGCFQDRVALVDTRGSSAEHGSINYA